MSKQDIENIKKGVSDGFTKLYEFAVGAEAQVNDATANFASSVRKSLSFGLEQYSSTRSRIEDASGTATVHCKTTEEEILGAVRTNVKKGIQWCNDYPLFAYGGAMAALFMFPAPRAFLFKSVFGAFQSQESAFRAATERFATLSETSQTLSKQKAEAVESEVREAMAPLKHKDVIAVRSDVARTASEVRTDQKEVESVMSKLQAYQVS